MKNKLFLILIILVFTACEKPVVDTAKEAENVRAIVSKISVKNVNKVNSVPEKKSVLVTKKVAKSELDFSLLIPSNFVYPYKNRKDPFYSLMLERQKMKAELEEKKRKEEEEKQKAQLGTNMVKEQWGKIEIMAILGNGKGFLVLFGGDDTIYQKNDYIDKDQKIKVVNISKNSVDLVMNKDGIIKDKRIVMKLEK